jgi:hypothetical protein
MFPICPLDSVLLLPFLHRERISGPDCPEESVIEPGAMRDANADGPESGRSALAARGRTTRMVLKYRAVKAARLQP